MPSDRPRRRVPHYCSFCGKAEHEVFHLVAGPTVFICDECVQLCQDVIAEKMAQAGTVIEHETKQ